LGAVETVRIIKELVEIWPNEVCDKIIAFLPSGKMAALKLWQFAHTELCDTTTWELMRSSDIEYKPEVTFSADDDWIAVFTESLVTIYNLNHPKNRLSFNPWPKGRKIC